MKKSKSRTGSASSKKRTSPSTKARAKRPGRSAGARRTAPARESAGMEMLAESIAELAAIAAELRQVTDDLRDMMAAGGEESDESVVIAELEPSE